MKRTYLYFLTLITWLMPALLHAATAVWSPTWSLDEATEHVSYEDHSTNCPNNCYFMDDVENGFLYYLYDEDNPNITNTPDNPGYLNVKYFLKDKVVLEKGASYTFSLKVMTRWTYRNLRNAKVRVQLRDGTTSSAKVLRELGDIDINFNSDGSAQTKSLDFGSAPAGGYICLTLMGELIGTIYTVELSDFSIVKGAVSPPVITKQPTMSPNIDVDNVPTLSVTATGENLKYRWYYKRTDSGWTDSYCESSSFTPSVFYPSYKYKCVVSNAAGDKETVPVTVESITLHGTEYPAKSGKYYTTVVSAEDFTLDEHTVAYKAVANVAKNVLNLVHVRQEDPCIPNKRASKGLILESTKRDIVLSVPTVQKYTTTYDDNALTDYLSYNKATSYVLGVRNGKLAMYPGTEASIPVYTACYNGDKSSTEHPESIALVFPAQCTVTFDKNADDATGTMADQRLFDDGNTMLSANSFTRPSYNFLGWSTAPNGKVEYTDKQQLTSIPTVTGKTITLYAQWQEIFLSIGNTDDWTNFCNYVANTNNGINAKLTADVSGVTVMVGSEARPYTGKFDGQGHKLTINYERKDEPFTAPFQWTKGATIKNLTVEGKIITPRKFAASIVGMNSDGSTKRTVLERCVSNVIIQSEINGDGSHGGLVGVSNQDMVIESCAFNGAINNGPNYKTQWCGGFVGWSNGTAYISNSLLNATFDMSADGSNTFVRKNAKLVNCYYVNALGSVPAGATQIASDKCKNGEALELLGANWAQTLGSDEAPAPYLESKKETPNYIYNDGTGWVCEDFRMENKADVNIGLDFTAKTLSYNRPFTIDDGYYTVYAPFAIPTTNGKLYACTGINADKSEAAFSEITTPEANTAYIFKPATTQLSLGNNVEVKKTSGLPTATGCLRGVYSLLTFTDDNKADCYGYAAEVKDGYEAGAFVKFGTGATVPSGRAYIYAPDASGAKRLNVIIEGETTAITIPVVGNNDETPAYNLSGQRVGNGYKGIVICNGKKTVRK